MSIEKLRKTLKEDMARLGIRKAVIIDDLIGETNSTNWNELVSVLGKEDVSTYEEFDDLCDREGNGDLNEIPEREFLRHFQSLADRSVSPKARELAKKLDSGDEIENLKTLLHALGLEVQALPSPPSDVPDVQLCFIDYRLTPDDPDSAGEAAAHFLKLMATNTNGHPIPATALMSREIDGSPCESEWEEVARNGAFLRLKYRFLNKRIINHEAEMLFFLFGLLSTYDLGEKYAESIVSFRTAISKAINKASEILYALKPSDFHAFTSCLITVATRDPSSSYKAYHKAYMAEHLLGVFSDLLNQELRNDRGLNTIIQSFHDVLSQTPLPEEFQFVEPMHEVYARILYDRSERVVDSPTSFGDIYHSFTSYWLVLTPECDLEPHNEAQLLPKVDKILLLKGQLQSDYSLDALPFPDQSAPWLSWKLTSPRVVNYRTLQKLGNYTKWGRLREREAEKVQSQFASGLIRVGTADIPGPTRRLPLYVWKWKVEEKHHEYLGKEDLLQRVPISAKVKEVQICLPAPACAIIIDHGKVADPRVLLDSLSYMCLADIKKILLSFGVAFLQLKDVKQLNHDQARQSEKDRALTKFADCWHLVIGQKSNNWEIPVATLLACQNN